MIAAAVAAVVAFIVIGVVMSRQTKQRKNAAIEDLQREKKEVGKTDIFAIVTAEVQDLGLHSIAGADDLNPEVLLKVWKDNSDVVERCTDRAELRFVLAKGVAPQEARNTDVTLICDAPTPLPTDEA